MSVLYVVLAYDQYNTYRRVQCGLMFEQSIQLVLQCIYQNSVTFVSIFFAYSIAVCPHLYAPVP